MSLIQCVHVFRVLISTLLLLAGSLLAGSLLVAQQPGFPGSTVPQPNQSLELSPQPEVDTTRVFLFQLDDIEKRKEFSDTTLHEFHLYSPIEKGFLFSQSLGNLGSSSRPLLYDIEADRKGLRLGYHQYDPYRLERQDFNHIRSKKSVTNLFFSPGANQRNFIIKAQFSRPFKNDVQLTLDYTRVIQEGFYASQDTRLTNVGMSISKKYENLMLVFTAISNADNESHNGGVTFAPRDTLFLPAPAQFRSTIPTLITEGQTRHATQEYALNSYFNLKRYENIQFRHEIALERGSFKYTDENIVENAVINEVEFYGPFLNDDRGIRSFVDYTSIKNSLWASLRLDKFDVDVGFNYSFYNINLEARTETVNDLGLLGRVGFELAERFSFIGDAYLGIGENVGEFTLNGTLSGELIDGIELKAFATFQAFRPSILQLESFINQQVIWDNRDNFSNPLENQLGGTLNLSRFGIGVTAKVLIRNNPIFINTDRVPEQFNGSVFNTQFLLNTKHKLFFLNLENQVGIQQIDNNIFQLPSFLSEHELYVEEFIFKKRMLSRFGVRLRTVEEYIAAGFSPVHGFFHQSIENVEQPFFWQTDLYLSFKVDKFRAFIRAENFNQLITGDVFFLADPFPIFDYKLRFGVGWTLYN